MAERESQFTNENELEQEMREDVGDKKSVLDTIKEKTKEVLEGLSDSHGLEHTILVADLAKLLATGEQKNIINAEMAGWTHDWGRALEKNDKEHRHHAVLSRESSKDIYRKLWEQHKITASQYGDIQRAISRHSEFKETPHETLKIVRDADRLSRFGSLGIYHVILFSSEEGNPFYIEGHPIIRSADAPILKEKDVKCAVDDINFFLGFKKILETDSAKKIYDKLENTSKEFLKLFANHRDLNNIKLWLDFLQNLATEFKSKREEFAKNFSWTGSKDDFDSWLKFYEEAEGPEIFSEENFQEFLKKREKLKEDNL